ncbi:MAG: hypothetical protein AAGB04_32715, partial [Pseudomonadota bacterium]
MRYVDSWATKLLPSTDRIERWKWFALVQALMAHPGADLRYEWFSCSPEPVASNCGQLACAVGAFALAGVEHVSPVQPFAMPVVRQLA